MPGAARYEQHHPEQQQQYQLKQLAVSVFEHLRKPSTIRHGVPGGRYGAKVAAGNPSSPTKNSKSFKSIRSMKSSRSIKSSRTSGRAADDELWEYAPPIPDILKDPAIQHLHARSSNATNATNDASIAPTSDAPAQPRIKRQLSHNKKLDADGHGSDSESDHERSRRRVRTQDFYDDYTKQNAQNSDSKWNDDDNGDDEDLGDDDEPEFDQVLTAEAQDELAYFSQRVGNSDFKLARRLVIHPHGRTRACWDSVVMLLITWILIVVPFELSFLGLDARVRRDLLRFDLFVDCMFVIDICLSFNTGIERDGKLHFSFRSIYRHYLRGWFFLDVIWTIPFYAFYEDDLFNPDLSSLLLTPLRAHSQLYNCFRVLRLLRVAKLRHVQRRLEYSLLISSKISSLGSFLFVVVSLSHVFSCMFAHLAYGDQEHLTVAIENGQLQNDTLQSKYIASFYWSMMTMTTVGYGDITVRTNMGRIFALAAMVVGGGIFAYGITNVVALFQQLYVDETEHRQKMDAVNTFMHSRQLPRKLRDEIRANFFHMRKATRESKAHDYKIFRQMSRTLQSNVATLFCQDMMPTKLPFLAGCNAEFIHELYLAMDVRCYLPGEDIIRQHDYGTEMYFLFVGHVQVFLSHTKVAALGPNAFFGEFGIFNPTKPRLATIQAMDFCETHCIHRRDVFRILLDHPFMLRSIQHLASLRSRKALNILYESGGKSRTLLQGLASMWHQDGGLLGMVPPDATHEDLVALQEYLPPLTALHTGATARRASVRATLLSNLSPADAAAMATALAANATTTGAAGNGGANGRRRSIVGPSSQDLSSSARASTARDRGSNSSNGSNDPSLHATASRSAFHLRNHPLGRLTNGHAYSSGTGAGGSGNESNGGDSLVRTRRRASIDTSDKAHISASLASIGRQVSVSDSATTNTINSNSSSSNSVYDMSTTPHAAPHTAPHAAAAATNNPLTTAAAATSDPRMDILIVQMLDIAKRQELLDDQLQELLQVLTTAPSPLRNAYSNGTGRFREQHRQSSAVPPLVRDRSQYFHRSLVIPEGRAFEPS